MIYRYSPWELAYYVQKTSDLVTGLLISKINKLDSSLKSEPANYYLLDSDFKNFFILNTDNIKELNIYGHNYALGRLDPVRLTISKRHNNLEVQGIDQVKAKYQFGSDILTYIYKDAITGTITFDEKNVTDLEKAYKLVSLWQQALGARKFAIQQNILPKGKNSLQDFMLAFGNADLNCKQQTINFRWIAAVYGLESRGILLREDILDYSGVGTSAHVIAEIFCKELNKWGIF